MGGEPWCFTPAEIGQLTDAQIWNQYVRPAVRRQQDVRRGGRPPRRKRRDASGGIPDREGYIQLGLSFGGDREHWEKEYDTWAASEEGRSHLARQAEREARYAARKG